MIHPGLLRVEAGMTGLTGYHLAPAGLCRKRRQQALLVSDALKLTLARLKDPDLRREIFSESVSKTHVRKKGNKFSVTTFIKKASPR
jgi:hypothetical protein